MWEATVPLIVVILTTALVAILLDQAGGLIWRRRRRVKLARRDELVELRTQQALPCRDRRRPQRTSSSLTWAPTAGPPPSPTPPPSRTPASNDGPAHERNFRHFHTERHSMRRIPLLAGRPGRRPHGRVRLGARGGRTQPPARPTRSLPDDRRHRSRRPDPDRDERHLGRRDADHLRLPVAALQLLREQLRARSARRRTRTTSSPPATSAGRSASR